MSNLVVVIGLIGGAASIMSFLLERAGIRGGWFHAAYGLFIALFASILVVIASSHSVERAVLESRIAGTDEGTNSSCDSAPDYAQGK